MIRTFCIDGRVYREVVLEAADSRASREHVAATRPLGFTTAKEIREGRRSL
jgi:hypothetical protein